MVELYMIVCLIVNPSKCEEQRLDFAQRNVAPMQLERQGQILASQWMAVGDRLSRYFLAKLGSRKVVGQEARI